MSDKTDLLSKNDIFQLVLAFYQEVKADQMLGPVFNTIVEDWDEHHDLITNFWAKNLFGEAGYQGNPLTAHQQVDRKMAFQMSTAHFGQWLLLWFQTIDRLFAGKNAETLKRRARKMSTFLFLKVAEARKS